MTAPQQTRTDPTPGFLCIAVLGPTCSWKSSVALLLAEQCDAEIVSCDSMQVYRGMDIGTAKPSEQARAAIPHHLIDLLDIMQPYDLQRFLDKAKRAVADIAARKPVAILVGGTGLYAQALIYDFHLPPADTDLAATINTELRTRQGRRQLQRELQENGVAPARLASMPDRRLAREVEVLRLTGHSLDDHRLRRKQPLPCFRQFVILPHMDLLRTRIPMRTAQMLQSGWLDETERLVSQGLLHSPTARHAIGYAAIAKYLQSDNTRPADNELHARIAAETLRYARRQRTWFGRQHPHARIMPIAAPTTAPALADGILNELRASREI